MNTGATLNLKALAAALRDGTFTKTDLLLAASHLEATVVPAGVQNPYAVAAENWRLGFIGASSGSAPGSAAERFYNEGKAAREAHTSGVGGLDGEVKR